MKEISLEDIIRTIVLTGKRLSGAANSFKEVDIIAEVCAQIIIAIKRDLYGEIDNV